MITWLRCENAQYSFLTIYIEAQPYQIRTVCDHVFHRQCLLTWMVDTEHDNCPSCRFAPLYDTKVYQARMVAEYPNTITSSPQLQQQQRPEQAPPPVPSRTNWHYMGYWIILVLALMALIAKFMEGPQWPKQQPPNLNGSSSPLQENNDTSLMAEDGISSSSCDNYLQYLSALGSLTVREQTVFCSKTPQRPCAICGNVVQSEQDCFCYCTQELQRPNAWYTNQCCQCSSL